MPQIQSGSIVSINIDYRVAGQQCLLTHHVKMETNFGATWDMITTFDLLHAHYDGLGQLFASLCECWTTTVSIDHVYYQVISLNRYRKYGLIPGNVTGTVAPPTEPPNVAHVVNVFGEFGGPRYRGSKHIGGVPGTFISNGRPTNAAVEAYSAVGNALTEVVDVDGVGGITATPILYRRDNPSLSPQIFTMAIGDTTRTMRRRTVGLGT